MLKVLIADDEMLVRIGLKTSIPWGEEYGFELVGEAVNGQDAWQKIQQTEPDILITDIQMPKMDGLELLRLIQESGRDIRSIILTCHSDFDYAREAIHFGVEDYVLKLTTMPDELLSILLKIKNDLLRTGRATGGSMTVPKAERNIIFLDKLKSGEFTSPGALRAGIRALDLQLDADGIFSLRLESDRPASVITQEVAGGLPINTLCANLLEEWLQKNKNGELFTPDGSGFLLLLNGTREKIQTAVKSLQQLLLQYLNLPFSIGISGPCGKSTLQQICDECAFALEQKFFHGENSILFFSDFSVSAKSSDTYSYHVETEILESLSRLDTVQVEQLLFPLAAEICQTAGSRQRCMERLDEILSTFSRAAKLYGGGRSQFCAEQGEDWYTGLHGLTFSREVIPWFGSLIPPFCEYLRRCKNQQCRSEVLLIQDYIREHYSEKITLEFAASYVFMSPAHFSKLFKRNTGKNFVDYLGEFRIEKAKRLLLESSLLIYQISEQTGYTSFNYFTKVFKKYTGVTPEEYRQATH